MVLRYLEYNKSKNVMNTQVSATAIAGTTVRDDGPFLLSISVFMAALWNRTGHYNFILWFLLSSSFFSSFFLA